MGRATLIWSFITGGLLLVLFAAAGALLAVVNGSSVAGSIMTGAAAAGGFGALWIAGLAVVNAVLKP